MSLELPPLRKREGDVLLLIKALLGREWTITAEAQHALEAYQWPGNVRQLKNALERAQILANDHVITIDDLPSEVADPHDSPVPVSPLSQIATTNGATSSFASAELASPRLEDLEKAHIVDILRQQNGNKARTARILGIHRRKLYRLLERYGITDDRIV
jgi:DNA-binding NtrC family response regulator